MGKRLITRDPFAREELYKDHDGEAGSCDWCGNNGRLFLFHLERDDRNGRQDPIRGRFCSVGCMRSYHT